MLKLIFAIFLILSTPLYLMASDQDDLIEKKVADLFKPQKPKFRLTHGYEYNQSTGNPGALVFTSGSEIDITDMLMFSAKAVSTAGMESPVMVGTGLSCKFKLRF